jgi:hypothetical protein
MAVGSFSVAPGGLMGPLLRAVSSLALAVVLSGAARAQGPALFQGTQHEVGVNPYSVALGDLDGDGVLDAATANTKLSFSGVGNVTTLLGDGRGGFRSRTDVGLSARPVHVAFGEFDGDGCADLVTANDFTDDVSVLIGDGMGGFAPPSYFAVGNDPNAVAVADLDGDGNEDLVTAEAFGDTLSILRGDGAGGFGSKTTLTGHFGASSVAVADLNADGILDLLSADAQFGTFTTRLGTAGGSYGFPQSKQVGSLPSSIAAGDVNGDGITDVITANSGASSVSVYFGTGNGGFYFGAQRDYATGPIPREAILVELDDDGSLDIAAGVDVGLSLLLNDGAGAFGAPAGPTLAVTYSVASGDLDGDSDADLVAVNDIDDEESDPSFLVVFQNDGAGGFPGTTPYASNASAFDLALADFDGNGLLDVASPRANGVVEIRSGDGLGGLGPASSFSAGFVPSSLVVGDLNGDDEKDVVAGTYLAGRAIVLLGDGAGGLGGPTSYVQSGFLSSVALGDVDRDGVLDLATASGDTPNLVVRLGTGTGTFEGRREYVAGGDGIVLADLDDDGDLDAATCSGVVNGSAFIRLGDGVGGFGPLTSFATGSQCSSIAAGDLDEDGKLDLATSNFTGGSVTLLLGDGSGGFPTRTDFPGSGEPIFLRIVDANGDTHLDFLVSDRREAQAEVFLGSGTGAVSWRLAVSLPESTNAIAGGDLDQDGRLEFVTGDTFSSQIYVVRNIRTGTASATSRNGTGANAECYSVTSLPVLGATFGAEIDVTDHPGATLTALVFYTRPDPGFSAAFGEVLVALSSPKLATSLVAPSNGIAVHAFGVPNDPALVDFPFFSQAAILGGYVELCNAFDGVLGR